MSLHCSDVRKMSVFILSVFITKLKGRIQNFEYVVSANRCLEYLLRNDANPGIRDKQGYNAVHYSAAYGHRLCLQLVRFLNSYGTTNMSLYFSNLRKMRMNRSMNKFCCF